MIAVLRDAGIPIRPLLADAGLRAADVERPHGELTGEQELRLERAFVEHTRDRPGLWLETGSRYRLLSYGPFGLVVLNARSVSRAVELATGFHELAFTLIGYSLLRGADGAVRGMDADLSAVPDELRTFMVVRDLAAVRRLLDDTIHGTFPIREIRASVPAPRDLLPHVRRLGAPVHFGSSRTQVVFEPRWREMKMPYGNPLLEETYERQCRELMASLSTRSTELEQVVDLLVRCRSRWPTFEEVAGRIGVSSRTLRRRLAEKGESYRALVDSVRRKQAGELLEDTALSVERIADALGYAEPASFTHAFRRWSGCSPREFRRRANADRRAHPVATRRGE